MRRAALVVALVFALSGAAIGCGGSHEKRKRVEFVASPKSLIAACRRTARAVGYAVPCPTRVPQGPTESGMIGSGAGSWRGWVVGSSTTADQHLVITASPRPLRNDAKVVNGPSWYPTARVTRLAWIDINGSRVHAVFVPPATNDGSAFARHVVLIWTVGNHTYAVGFHDMRGIQRTLALDEELADSIELVGG